MSLTRKTMLAYLKIEVPGMSGKDKRATARSNQYLCAGNDTGYYYKYKLDKKNIKNLTVAASRAREIHKDLTRPFSDNGDRLLPTTLIKKYTDEMRTAKKNFEDAVHDLEIQWPAIIAKQETRLSRSNTFDPMDYPFVRSDGNGGYVVDQPVNLSKIYTFKFDLKPTPDKNHLVIDLEAETLAELKEQLEEQNRKNLEDSKKELWKRLFDPVANMAKICLNDKKVFDSLVGNLEHELDILKDLNVTNDSDLTIMLEDVRHNLLGFTPGQIRDDKQLKQSLGSKAKNLSDIMSGYMGANPN